jgi:hypothetical protein
VNSPHSYNCYCCCSRSYCFRHFRSNDDDREPWCWLLTAMIGVCLLDQVEFEFDFDFEFEFKSIVLVDIGVDQLTFLLTAEGEIRVPQLVPFSRYWIDRSWVNFGINSCSITSLETDTQFASFQFHCYYCLS